VQHRFYLGGRHESLNESNRDEVTRDLIGWLNSVIARAATSSSGPLSGDDAEVIRGRG
jgi:hypothetical protein